MQRLSARALSGLLPLALAAGAADQDQSQPVDETRARFLEVCAACHGESGDGRGTTELDRPARSFLDGGFSYGNTEQAIYRSLSYGIPGTPMPAAPDGWTEEQRRALARYVISLGPERTEVDPQDTVLVVEDRAVVVRGYLPPIADGKPERPRGLLLGLPSGASFEYRADDVRLLGVRQGAFVERRDWQGRGGQPLLPLGKPTLLSAGGDPGPFARRVVGDETRALAAHLRGTWTRSQLAGVAYDLVDREDVVAKVREGVQNWSTSMGAGFLRTFEIQGGARDIVLKLDVYLEGSAELTSETDIGWAEGLERAALHFEAPDGLHHYVAIDGTVGTFETLDDALRVRVAAGARVELAIGRTTAAQHDEALMSLLLEEVQ